MIEYRHLVGKASRNLMKEIENVTFTVVYLKTEFEKLKDIKRAIDELNKRAKLAVLRTYKELGEIKKGSRYEDWCLLVIAFKLAENGVKVVVISRDKGIATACKEHRELGYTTAHEYRLILQ